MADDEILIPTDEMRPLIDELISGCRTLLPAADQPVTMIGIHTGGVWVAEQLHAGLSLETPLSTLDASYYRDDLHRSGLKAQPRQPDMPVSLQGHHVLLVDDVLQTGRTIRAAMNEIFDHGRPESVRLIALVDRGGRELPIQPDLVGRRIDVETDVEIKINGPDPLQLVALRATA